MTHTATTEIIIDTDAFTPDSELADIELDAFPEEGEAEVPAMDAKRTAELNKLLRQHESRLRRLAVQLVGDTDADDVLQDAMIRAFKGFPRFRGDSQFYTWMYRIVRNVAYNKLSNRTRELRVMSSYSDIPQYSEDSSEGGDSEWFDNLGSHEEDACALLESQQAQDKIVEALARLEADLPSIFIAFNDVVLNNRPYEEVAAEAGVPVGNIRSRVFRARQHLTKVLRAMEGEEDYTQFIKPRLML